MIQAYQLFFLITTSNNINFIKIDSSEVIKTAIFGIGSNNIDPVFIIFCLTSKIIYKCVCKGNSYSKGVYRCPRMSVFNILRIRRQAFEMF